MKRDLQLVKNHYGVELMYGKKLLSMIRYEDLIDYFPPKSILRVFFTRELSQIETRLKALNPIVKKLYKVN